MSVSLLLIHGFLGMASDWDPIHLEYASEKINLFSPNDSRAPLRDFEAISNYVNQQALKLSSPRVIVGYSLGGRIALHALEHNPTLWQGAIIISAHPGLRANEIQLKKERLEEDEAWASQVISRNWDQLMKEWSLKSVFKANRPHPERREEDFSKKRLADGMKNFSLGRQKDQREFLRKLNIPILWLVGEEDQKYMELGRSVAQVGNHLHLQRIPGASHRILTDQPERLKAAMDEFLKKYF